MWAVGVLISTEGYRLERAKESKSIGNLHSGSAHYQNKMEDEQASFFFL